MGCYFLLKTKLKIAEHDSEKLLIKKLKHEFCEYSHNCKSGSHNRVFCFSELEEGKGRCDCQIKSEEDAKRLREELSKELCNLQDKRVALLSERTKDNRQELKALKYDINVTSRKIAETVYKVHPVSDLNYDVLHDIKFRKCVAGVAGVADVADDVYALCDYVTPLESTLSPSSIECCRRTNSSYQSSEVEGG